ncbi:altronate dehydratase [Shinella sp. WSJ-2]|uniref:UxaA family hydrolase n=1 Tax=Shinella sp. WSJ-2 TaxID=2303749 RepID=UPI000E3CF878|nr:altronate dehydratase family protein [Shinella sp. WSJ-2]RFZ87093.1 altronate dehydratase [Shinella sp. WSJ-2]
MLADVPAVLVLNPKDNVGVVPANVDAGRTLVNGVAAVERIPRGHKVAIAAIAENAPVLKYGQIIGYATKAIRPGEHVHLQNLAILDVALKHEFCVDNASPVMVPQAERRTFDGYDRGNGRIGTRNYIGILSTVNCSATVSRYVAEHYARKFRETGHENIDGVVALTYGGGCALNLKSEGGRILTRTFKGYARNPNFGGILMIGLGCETFQYGPLIEEAGLEEGKTFRKMMIQEQGGTRKTIEAACAMIDDMLPDVGRIRRTPQPLSGIKLALECGGSDGYSGISANPALGIASDLLVQEGATTVLSETPEIYGAEHLLTRRAARPEVAEKLLARIEWWREYTAKNDAELNNNPSFGNKAGGLTTILEKSLGAVAKGGSMPLNAVYEYAEEVTEPGFVFMDTPGYDPAAVTGQIAGGCNLVAFTTGRGSVSGYKPAPCIKIATNTPMYEHIKEDMDINCGTIVDGTETIEQAGRRIFDFVIETASGRKTASEAFDYGDNEFVPWQVGAIT